MFVHNDAFLICEMFKCLGFDDHFHSYLINTKGTFDLIKVTNLFKYYPLHIRNSYDLNDKSMFITLSHNPCCTNDSFLTV